VSGAGGVPKHGCDCVSEHPPACVSSPADPNILRREGRVAVSTTRGEKEARENVWVMQGFSKGSRRRGCGAARPRQEMPNF
jgi:hypothetical protein